MRPGRRARPKTVADGKTPKPPPIRFKIVGDILDDASIAEPAPDPKGPRTPNGVGRPQGKGDG